MIVDIDNNGNISIMEINPEVAIKLQSAILHVIEAHSESQEHDRELRRIAIQIDRLIKKT